MGFRVQKEGLPHRGHSFLYPHWQSRESSNGLIVAYTMNPPCGAGPESRRTSQYTLAPASLQQPLSTVGATYTEKVIDCVTFISARPSHGGRVV